MNRHATHSLFAAVLAIGALASGCSSPGGGMMGDPGLMRGGEPSSSELAELCDLQRRMAGLTPEAQEALLESHMQAAHGNANPQSMTLHRNTMRQRCRG
jgi:hypothetical protein